MERCGRGLRCRKIGRGEESEGRERDTERGGQREGRRERENSNSKTLFYKDCSLGLVKNLSNS